MMPLDHSSSTLVSVMRALAEANANYISPAPRVNPPSQYDDLRYAPPPLQRRETERLPLLIARYRSPIVSESYVLELCRLTAC